MTAPSRITAVLGPTNTGKTHYAIERMLGHRSGIIGLPLRLLAREVYDRIVRARGPSVVALVTGEEHIVPPRAQYWVCTVEAMPEGMGTDFLAVDEIQLCADPERGHVFTDRLLHARGQHETLLLGSETMRMAIAALVPGVTFLKRDRFSTLTYSGSKKISRMPERSAIVGFSVENVYAIAEFIRRSRGGAAVVMGALSPRTRNAQVALYQNGDVDFLVATDAIGMGLNLDIGHVAFSGLSKFDGHRMRDLAPDELAQIAGRAGRHLNAGTFGVTGEAPDLDPEVVEAIENHQFRPVTKLKWRNTRLQFGTLPRLIQTLEEKTDNPWLSRVRESDDLAALKALAADAEVAARATSGPAVRLLWDVCRIPDFRGISKAEHAALLGTIFNHLHQRGHVPADWFAQQVQRIDRSDGDIDTLSKRLAYVRTWTYVAQRNGWVPDESHWRDQTRAVEDRLSDALHSALTARFVDRRTSVLARRLRQKEVLVAEVNDKGEVTVEGEFVGRLEGFRFRADKAANVEEGRTLRQAAQAALAPHLSLRADRFYNAPDTEIDFTEQGGLMWGEHAVGKLVAGPAPLRPGVQAFVDEEAGEDVAQKVTRRLQHFIDRKLAAAMEPLLALQKDESLTGLARGFAYRLVENLGILPRGDVSNEVKELDQEARSALRKLGVRFGQFTVFLPPLLKPAPTRLRLVLWGLHKGLSEFPSAPPPGHVTVLAARDAVPGFYAMSGYRAAGDRAIRIDMLERLADLLRDRDSRAGFEAVPEMLSITGLSADLFASLMTGLGYRAEKAERPKVKGPKPGSRAAQAASVAPASIDAPAPEATAEPPAPEATAEPPAPEATAEAPAPEATAEAPAPEATAEAQEPAGPVEMESYWTFTWGGRAARGERRDSPRRGDRPQRGPRRDASGPSTPAAAADGTPVAQAPRPPRGPRPDRRPPGADGQHRPPPTEGEPAPQAAEGAQAGDNRPRDARPPRRNGPPGDRPQGQPPRDRADKPKDKSRYLPQGGAKTGPREGGARDGAPREGGSRDGAPRPDRGSKPQVYVAAPPREERKAVDPDNPFAALAALKLK